jgi:hypothetical protein
MRISSRYLATERRVTWSPSAAEYWRSGRLWVGGGNLLPRSVSSLALQQHQRRVRPFRPARTFGEEEPQFEDALRSVDIFVRYRAAYCRRVHAISSAISLIIIGLIASTPFSRKSRCHRMIDSHVRRIVFLRLLFCSLHANLESHSYSLINQRK